MSNTSGDVWQTVDYKGRIVTLRQEQVDHIAEGDGRSNQSCNWADAIKQTIEDADIVIPGRFDDTEVHIKKIDSEDTIKGKWLHVPVGYQGQFGDVKTAIPKTELSKKARNLYVNPKLWTR